MAEQDNNNINVVQPNSQQSNKKGKFFDPLKFCNKFWPRIRFYKQQQDIIYSVVNNKETIVPAGNMLGKDFVTAFITLWFFFSRHPCRVITTSADSPQLEAVLWGEIRDLINKSRYPLEYGKGGILVVNHLNIRKVVNGKIDGLSYIKGRVSDKQEGMLGHHIAETGDGIPRTLFVADEACHDDKTEVLTDSGWKYFNDLTGEEKLFSIDPLTLEGEYHKPTHITKAYREGEMYLCEKRGSNFCVTPNHKMLWIGQKGSYYKLQQIDKITKSYHMIPRQCVWVGEDIKTFTIPGTQGKRKIFDDIEVSVIDWLNALGWFISEGSFTYDKGILTGINIAQKDSQTLYNIADIFDRMGFKANVYEFVDSPCVKINDRRLAEYLIQFGRYCYEKRVPDFIFKLTPSLIEIFLQTFKAGDGYDREEGREIYYTSSEKLANDLQILSIKTGRNSTICKRFLIGLPIMDGRTSKRDGYVVSRTSEHASSHAHITLKNIKKIDYKGYVYCATIPPYDTLLTRRNGICLFSGNSSIPNETWEVTDTWAKRKLAIGNCYPCENFFKHAVKGKPGTDDKGGDIPRPKDEGGYYRKIIKITAEDSPNVRKAKILLKHGIKIRNNAMIIPGVLPWSDYRERRERWDKVRQCIGLDAEFYEGAEVLMFPPLWLNRANQLADDYEFLNKKRIPRAMGVDPAEGGDNTCWTIIDEYGIIKQISKKTPKTDIIPNETLALMFKYKIDAKYVAFDRGGGGKQAADRLRAGGYPVLTVAFNEKVTPEPKRSKVTVYAERVDQREERYAYFNRRAEMYGTLMELLDPDNSCSKGFAIPKNLIELRSQLAPIPKVYIEGGILKLPPKTKKEGSKEPCLIDIIGHSPDEADSLVLAIHALKQDTKFVVSAGTI